MKVEEINDLVSKYADELYEGYDMADFQNEENKETVTVICAAFLGHILETHDILPKSPESATIEGYVCREMDGDISFINGNHPYFEDGEWYGGYEFSLPDYSLPSLTFENSPRKVRITITPIEDE